MLVVVEQHKVMGVIPNLVQLLQPEVVWEEEIIQHRQELLEHQVVLVVEEHIIIHKVVVAPLVKEILVAMAHRIQIMEVEEEVLEQQVILVQVVVHMVAVVMVMEVMG